MTTTVIASEAYASNGSMAFYRIIPHSEDFDLESELAKIEGRCSL
jgi:hypothetical protein